MFFIRRSVTPFTAKTLFKAATTATPSSSSFFGYNSITTTTARTMSSFYDLKAELPSGDYYNFDQLKGKVALIVNMASKCGFTKQNEGLQKLYNEYKDQGFVILGFPCNQFGNQEPGSDEDIASFCQLNYGVDYPLMKKSDVNGDNTNEVYKYLKDKKSSLMLTRIKWNYEKFLIDKEGNVVERYASTKEPESLKPKIEELLKK